DQLRISGEEYLQALYDRDRAVSAFLPTISLSPSYGFVSNGGFESAKGTRRNTFIVPVGGGYTNFNAFANVADLTAEQRRLLVLELQVATLLDAAQAYSSVLQAGRQVVVVLENIELQEA